jgi:hypothetical protein
MGRMAEGVIATLQGSDCGCASGPNAAGLAREAGVGEAGKNRPRVVLGCFRMRESNKIQSRGHNDE